MPCQWESFANTYRPCASLVFRALRQLHVAKVAVMGRKLQSPETFIGGFSSLIGAAHASAFAARSVQLTVSFALQRQGGWSKKFWPVIKHDSLSSRFQEYPQS